MPSAYDLYLRAKPIVASPDLIKVNLASLEAVVVEAPGFAEFWLLPPLWDFFAKETDEKSMLAANPNTNEPTH